MTNLNLIILSYHNFVEGDPICQYDRSYSQFENDLNTKDFDWITIDDAQKGQIKACDMMRQKNIRAKLFVSTASIGEDGFCDWDDIVLLSKYHDICNHSHFHKRLIWFSNDEIFENIQMANELIKTYTGVTPRYFVPPYNKCDKRVETIAGMLGLTTITDRIDILNTTA